MREWRPPATALRAMLVVSFAVVLTGLAETVELVDAQSTPLQRYEMVGQWPAVEAKKPGELWRPIDLDVAPDGTLFISDPDAGGVHRMRPNGEFASMLGRKGSGDGAIEESGPLAVARAPDPDDVRLYVIDVATDRIVAYDLEGQPVDVWQNIYGSTAITATADGYVFLADALANWMWAYDSAGRVPYVWGQPGTGPGEFERFTDVSVLPSGEAIAVGDLGGERVQIFDLPPSGVREPTLRHEFDLTDPRHGNCRADVVNLLNRGSVWVGQGDHACVVTSARSEPRIAPSALNHTICRETVSLPRVLVDGEQYFAVALSDPNPGECGKKGTALATSMIVVRYDDADFSSVARVWPAIAKPDLAGVGLFAPSRVSLAGGDVLMIQDEATYHRYFDYDGQLVRSVIKEPLVAGWDVERHQVQLVTASDTVGEPLIFYAFRDEVGQSQKDGYGIGRLTESQRYAAGEVTHFVEPIWMHVVTNDAPDYFDQDVPIDLVYNPVTDEAVLLYASRERRAIEQDTRLSRVSARTGVLSARGDTGVPQDLVVNTFEDLSVGADGRLYALDTFADRIVVMESSGEPAAEIPVAVDAYRVAAGPAGNVFVLRWSGAVERIDQSGSVNARFDARPLSYSDPTTLEDLAVADDGRVFVLDGQVGAVSVFAPADTGTAPVPDDGTCAVSGSKHAAPTHVAVGQPVTVTLGLEGRCGSGESPSDIMIIATAPGLGAIPRTGEIIELFSALDFDKHRVGMASHLTNARLEFPLAEDRAEFASGVIAAARSPWPDRRNVAYRMGPAVRIAHENLPTEQGRRRVILLFRPLNSTGFRNTPAPWPEIEAAELDGVRVMAYGWGREYPPNPDDFAKTIATGQRLIVDRREPEHLAVQLDLVDVLGDTMTIVDGSASPAATVSGRDVRWAGHNLPPGRSEFTVQVQPMMSGRHATNASAAASFVDGYGQPGRIEFTSPMIDVAAAPPTPTPTSTTAPPPTVDPTRHAPTRTLFVPAARQYRYDSPRRSVW